MARHKSNHVEIIIKVDDRVFVVPESQLLSISFNSMLEFETVDVSFFAPDGFMTIAPARIEGGQKMIEGEAVT